MAIDAISYTITAFVYLALFAALLTDKHRGKTKLFLLLAAISSCVWAISVVLHSIAGVSFFITQIFEIAHNLFWLALIISMISGIYIGRDLSSLRKWLIPFSSALVVIGITLVLI